MNKLRIITAIFLSFAMLGCATNSQNQYMADDIGKQVEVEFGTVVAYREVKVQHERTGIGATTGGVAGAAAGSAFGSGDGQLYAALGGLIVGAVSGAFAEQAIQNKKGIEYTITENNGKTVTIVQNIAKDDAPIKIGQRVMVQKGGNYMRVLPAQNLPTQIKRPKKIKVVD